MLYLDGESTAHTRLLVPLPQHFDFLLALALEAGLAWPWPEPSRSTQALERSLYEGTFDHAVVVRSDNNAPIGYVSLKHVNRHHGFASLYAYFRRGSALGFRLEAVRFLLDRAFSWLELYSVTIEMDAHGFATAFGSDGHFSEVHRFRNKLLIRGERVDSVVAVISRDDWQGLIARVDRMVAS